MAKAIIRKTADEVLFDAGLDLCTLQNLFECINEHAEAELSDGDPAVETFALTLQCIAEKGIRETEAALKRLNHGSKARREVSHG